MRAISRRGLLLGLGGGVASASIAWVLGLPGLWAGRAVDPYPVDPCCGYADYAGWLVTTKDKERLMARASMPTLEGVRLEGGDIASQHVNDVDECAGWCLIHPDCQGFSYAHADHPKADERNRCSLKQSGDVTKFPDPAYTSGTR